MMGSVRGIADIAATDGKLFWTPTRPVHVNPPADIVDAYSNRARLRAQRLKPARLRGLPAVTRVCAHSP